MASLRRVIVYAFLIYEKHTEEGPDTLLTGISRFLGDGMQTSTLHIHSIPQSTEEYRYICNLTS